MSTSQPVVLSEPSLRAPGRESKLPLGEFPEFARDQLAFLERKWKKFGDVVAFRFGWLPVYFVAHPDAVKRVLQSYPALYDKNNLVSYRRMRRIVGNGLVTSEGGLWKRQRRIAQPAFEHRRLDGFIPHIQRSLQDMQQEWENWAAEGKVLNIHWEMRRLTLRIATLSLLGVDIARDHEDVGKALTIALDEFMHRLYSVVPLPEIIPTPRNRRFSKAQKKIEEVVQAIIDVRRKTGNLGDDLLGRLMAATDPETGIGMSDELLHDEVITMFFAAYENTAHALTWMWHFLAQYPQVREKLEQELATCLGGRLPVAEDFERLNYTKAVLQESMRLYTPVPLLSRHAVQDDVIGGYRIPKGSVVMVAPYITHRHPEFWNEPEKFDPERFMERTNRHRFAYFPFGGGPRVCIGASFAMLEATLVIGTLAQRFQLDLVPGAKVEFAEGISLRPRSGLPMKLTARHSQAVLAR